LVLEAAGTVAAAGGFTVDGTGAVTGGGPGLVRSAEVKVFEPNTEPVAQAGGVMRAAVHTSVSTPPPKHAFSSQRVRLSRRISQPLLPFSPPNAHVMS
jgi:hypothetical protein